MSVAPRCARQGASLLLILSLGGACSPLRFPEDAGPDAAVVQFDAAPEHADATETPPDAGEPEPDAGPTGPLTITPSQVRLGALRPFTFRASEPVTWTIREENGGHIFADGLYGAPEAPGVYHVVATSQVDATRTATAEVVVVPLSLRLTAGVPGGYGTRDGPGETAYFASARGVAALGPFDWFFTDSSCRIRRLHNGVFSTAVGVENDCRPIDGVGALARVSGPSHIVADRSALPSIIFAEQGCIRRLEVRTSSVVTVAGICGNSGHEDSSGGQSGSGALLGDIRDMSLGPFEHLYVCDSDRGMDWLRKIDFVTGAVETIALIPEGPCHLTIGYVGQIYVSTPSSGIWQFEAGPSGLTNGAAPVQVIPVDPGVLPAGLGVDYGASGEYLAMLVDGEPRVLQWPLSGASPNWTLLVGSETERDFVEGPLVSARLFQPFGLRRIEGADQLMVLDATTYRSIAGGRIETRFGHPPNVRQIDGRDHVSRFTFPQAVWLDDNGRFFIADVAYPGDGLVGNTIRRMEPATREVTTFSGTPTPFGNDIYTDGTGPEAAFGSPCDVIGLNGLLYVLDATAQAIRAVDPVSGAVTTVAGELGVSGLSDGRGAGAHFHFGDDPFSSGALATDGRMIFIADGLNHAIRKLDPSTGDVITLAGGTEGTEDGVGLHAQFRRPAGLAYLNNGLYISDLLDSTIRHLDLATNEVRRYAGLSGTSGTNDGLTGTATFFMPARLAADRIGNLYVADCATIRRIDLMTGKVSTHLGAPSLIGFAEGALPSSLGCARGLAIKSNGDLVLADGANGVIATVQAL